MKNIFRGITFAAFFFFNTAALDAQSANLKRSKDDFLPEMRPADLLHENIKPDFFSMTRFMQNILAFSLESWTSPSTKISFDGIPFSIIPFNLNSPDYLPFDQIVLEASAPSGYSLNGINFKLKDIEDSITFRFRGYVGSETGDPLIHSFTRINSPSININKIPLSGAASFSDAAQDLKYRFSLGYFAHFSSSSVNDPVMSFRNPRFYSKLDKQVLASAELNWNISSGRKLLFNSSFMSFYGWDIPPFMGSIIHFESYIFTVRSRLTNIVKNFNLIFRNDGSFNEINGMTGIPPAKFLIMETSIAAEWYAGRSEKINFRLVPEAALTTIKNRPINSVPAQQNFFSSEFNKFNFRLSGTAGFQFDESMEGNIDLKFETHFSGRSAVSLGSKVSKKYGQLKISAHAESAARFPSVSDLYGRFQIHEGEGNFQNVFEVTGRSDLKEERLNHIGIDAGLNYLPFALYTEFFLREIRNPIEQKTLNIKRTENPGDILRDAVLVNGDKKSGIGFIVSSSHKIIDPLLLKFSYRFIHNNGTDFFPRHKAGVSAEYNLTDATLFGLSWLYMSEIQADEYVLGRDNDEYLHSGFDGKTPKILNMRFNFSQNLGPFYFFNSLSLRIVVENLLERKIRFFPIGNETRREFIFFLSGRL